MAFPQSIDREQLAWRVSQSLWQTAKNAKYAKFSMVFLALLASFAVQYPTLRKPRNLAQNSLSETVRNGIIGPLG
jgi:hypothetical protein